MVFCSAALDNNFWLLNTQNLSKFLDISTIDYTKQVESGGMLKSPKMSKNGPYAYGPKLSFLPNLKWPVVVTILAYTKYKISSSLVQFCLVKSRFFSVSLYSKSGLLVVLNLSKSCDIQGLWIAICAWQDGMVKIPKKSQNGRPKWNFFQILTIYSGCPCSVEAKYANFFQFG